MRPAFVNICERMGHFKEPNESEHSRIHSNKVFHEISPS